VQHLVASFVDGNLLAGSYSFVACQQHVQQLLSHEDNSGVCIAALVCLLLLCNSSFLQAFARKPTAQVNQQATRDRLRQLFQRRLRR